jgi:imidazolonepropionase-like amidohydrolase
MKRILSVASQRLTAVVVLALTSIAAGEPSDNVAPPRVLAFTHVNVIDVEHGTVGHDATVIVDGNRIRAVGPSATTRVPPGALVLDATGKYMIPGLWDMHVHVTAEPDVPFELFPAFGVTSIRDVGGSLASLRALQRQLGPTMPTERIGPHLLICGPVLDGDPPLHPWMAIAADTPERARSAVRFLSDQGVSCIKTYEGIGTEPFAAAVHEAHAHRLPVAVHPSRVVTIRYAVEHGARGIEHLFLGRGDVAGVNVTPVVDSMPLLDRQAFLWNQVDMRSAAVRDLIRAFVVHHVFLTSGLVGDEANNIVPDSVRLASPDNAILSPETLRKWRNDTATSIISVSLRAKAAEGVRKRREFLKAASDAGVPILAGSGGPWLGSFLPGLGVHREMSLMVASGLSPLAALQSATLNPAKFFDAADTLGTIAPGKVADLVLLNANPLDDISNTERVAGVVVSGRYIDAETLAGLARRHTTSGGTSP